MSSHGMKVMMMLGTKQMTFCESMAHDLRVKVIGEGGNLGFTQLGRIEYALNGGRANTDSIDNSAGVDCSDHEVNIKIAVDNAVRNNRLQSKDRNRLLEEMTSEVSRLVLKDNILQTQFITTAQMQSAILLEGHARAIESLEHKGVFRPRY